MPHSSRPRPRFATGWKPITTPHKSCGSATTRRAPASPASPGRNSVDEALCFGWIDGLRKTMTSGRPPDMLLRQAYLAPWARFASHDELVRLFDAAPFNFVDMARVNGVPQV